MATKGYNTYRGRGSVKKAILIVFLVLIIVAAVGYLLVQNYIVYDDAGQARLELPRWQKPQKTDPDLPEDDVNIEYVEPPEKWLPVEEIHATQMVQGGLRWDPATILAAADEAMVIDTKTINGSITYTTGVEVSPEIHVEKYDTMENLKTLLAGGHYTVAKMSVLCDSYFVRADGEAALHWENGMFWYDADGWAWVDPTNANVLGYNTALCKEYAELGFDEIMLDYFCYPISGRTDAIVLDENLDKVAVLQSFAESLRNSLPEDVVLSVVIRSDVTAEYGLSPEMIASCFDRIYLAPGVDDTALLNGLPEEYDRSTRVVRMTYQKPESGSYVLLTQ